MERNFNNEFEKFLKESADQYRLYPSSKVWNGIYNSLHSRRKWFGLGLILLLLTGTSVTLLVTHSSKETVITTSNKPVLSKKITATDRQISASSERVTKNKLPNNNAVAVVATNRKTAVPSIDFYSIPVNSLPS